MSWIDLRKNVTPIPEVVPTPADWEPPAEEGIADLVAETGVDDVPTPTIDCSNTPKGTWGIVKITEWFDENGLYYDEGTHKDELIAEAKRLCAEQETS